MSKPAYLVVDIKVDDLERMTRYRTIAQEAIAKFGGHYLVRGGTSETLEGQWDPERIVIVRFDSAEIARQFYDSPEYREAKEAREGAGDFQMLLVEGL